MPLFVAVMFAIAVALPLIPERYIPRRQRLRRELGRIGFLAPTADRTVPEQSVLMFRLASKLPVGWVVRGLERIHGPVRKERFQQRVLFAGLEGRLTWHQFLALKAAIPLTGIAYMALVYANNGLDPALAVASPIPLMGFFVPDQWLGGRVKRRQSAIRRELPAVLTTLAISTEAGLHLTAAMDEVTRTQTGPLAIEFQRAVEQAAMGLPQGQALEAMAARCGVSELTLVISNLVQSFEKGAGHLAAMLRTQAQEAWDQRRRRAEELAQTASVRLFLPLVLLVFPAILIFLLGPALMTIGDFFSVGLK